MFKYRPPKQLRALFIIHYAPLLLIIMIGPLTAVYGIWKMPIKRQENVILPDNPRCTPDAPPTRPRRVPDASTRKGKESSIETEIISRTRGSSLASALISTGKFQQGITRDQVLLAFQDNPNLNPDDEGVIRECVECAKGNAGNVGSVMPWLRRRVSDMTPKHRLSTRAKRYAIDPLTGECK